MLRSVDHVGFDAGDPLLHAVRHRRLRGLCAEAIDESLQPVDLLALQHRLLGEALLVFGTGVDVLRVRAAVLDEVTDSAFGRTVEVQHAGDRFVEQFEIVADHQQRAPIAAQETHQPLLGVDVEVVGGLVEAEHVAAGEQDAGEFDAPPLTAREHADGEFDAVLAETESRHQAACLAVRPVATGEAEHLHGARVALDIAFVRCLLHRDAELLDPFQLGVDPASRTERAPQVFDRRVRRRCAGPGAGSRIRPCGRHVRRPARARHRARGTGWSCRRRCDRRGRPCRGPSR